MRRAFGIAFLIMIVCQVVAWRLNPGKYGTDLFPLYWAAQRLVDGEAIYGPDATAVLAEAWDKEEPFASSGIAYPLPMVVLVMPLAALPFWVATSVYNGISFLSLLLGLHQLNKAAVWFLPTPAMILGLALGQTSTLILAGMVWLVICLREQRWVWVAILALCVVLKPNMGILLYCWTVIQMIRQRSKIGMAAPLILAGGTLLGALSLLWWGQPWLQQAQVYNRLVNTDAFPLWVVALVSGLSLLTGPWAAFIASPLTQWFAYYPVAAWDCLLLTGSSRRINGLCWILIAVGFATGSYIAYLIAVAGFLIVRYARWRGLIPKDSFKPQGQAAEVE